MSLAGCGRQSNLETYQKTMAKLVHFSSTSLIVVSVLLSGCMQKISLSGKSDSTPPMHPATTGRRQLLTEPPPGTQNKPPDNSQPAPKPPPPDRSPSKDPVKLTGQWKVGFLYGTKNYTSTINLIQEGNSFHGTGTDDDSNLPFSIEEGTITGQQVAFLKKYSDGKHLPVQYGGSFQTVSDANYSGPYLSGEYELAAHGKPISSVWEAEMVSDEPAPQIPPGSPQPAAPLTAPPSPAPSPNHAPQLSGKWNVGFEYNFKTVHSTMYLEQNGGKLSGHGSDVNTKEKFVISKGWYNYPRVTIVRKYVKGKGAASDREVTFKATVTWVSESDYQGPYLNGKTQGGGAWEAQLYK
jgi:hypothetical protein